MLRTRQSSIEIRPTNLAGVLRRGRRIAEAESLSRRALATFEAAFGPNDFRIALALNSLAELLYHTERHAEAKWFYARAKVVLDALDA